MINPTCNLLNCSNFLDLLRLVLNHEFSVLLCCRAILPIESHMLSFRYPDIDVIDEYLPSLREHKHASLRESNLLDLCTAWQSGYLGDVSPIAISQSFDLNRWQLCFGACVKLALGVNVDLMVPAEGYVYDVWLIFSLELLNFLGREIAVILSWIDLEALTPHVHVRVHGLQALSILVSNECLSYVRPEEWHCFLKQIPHLEFPDAKICTKIRHFGVVHGLKVWKTAVESHFINLNCIVSLFMQIKVPC